MTIPVKEGQTLYDIAVQWYGDISGYWWLLADNGLTVESEVRAGDLLNIRDADTIADPAIYFRSTKREVNNSDAVSPGALPLTVEVKELQNEIVGGDGFILLDVKGGVAPYGFHWSNGSTRKNLLHASSGEYTVTVEDSLGAQVILTLFISATTQSGYLTTHSGDFILTKHGDRITITPKI